MYHSFFIHSSVNGHLGCFHVLALVNSAAVNIGLHVSSSVLVSSGYMPRNCCALTFHITSFGRVWVTCLPTEDPREFPKCRLLLLPRIYQQPCSNEHRNNEETHRSLGTPSLTAPSQRPVSPASVPSAFWKPPSSCLALKMPIWTMLVIEPSLKF